MAAPRHLIRAAAMAAAATVMQTAAIAADPEPVVERCTRGYAWTLRLESSPAKAGERDGTTCLAEVAHEPVGTAFTWLSFRAQDEGAVAVLMHADGGTEYWVSLDGTPTSIERGALRYRLALTPVPVDGIAIDVVDVPARAIATLLAERGGVRVEGIEHLSERRFTLRAEGAQPIDLLEPLALFDELDVVERDGAFVIEPATHAKDAAH